MEVPCSCMGTLTIAGWEYTPQVGSLLLVGLSPISNGCTLNTRIYITNSIVSVKVIIT